MRFSERRAEVTGGASGIGEALALRIKAEGGQVGVQDFNGPVKVYFSGDAPVKKRGETDLIRRFARPGNLVKLLDAFGAFAGNACLER